MTEVSTRRRPLPALICLAALILLTALIRLPVGLVWLLGLIGLTITLVLLTALIGLLIGLVCHLAFPPSIKELQVRKYQSIILLQITEQI